MNLMTIVKVNYIPNYEDGCDRVRETIVGKLSLPVVVFLVIACSVHIGG